MTNDEKRLVARVVDELRLLQTKVHQLSQGALTLIDDFSADHAGELIDRAHEVAAQTHRLHEEILALFKAAGTPVEPTH